MIRCLVFALAILAAIDLDVTVEDVDRALAIGKRPESAAFHAPYVFKLEQTVEAITVRQVEVVTPFRRVVQYADQQRGLGNYIVSRSAADEVLKPWRTRVAIVTLVRFHPQNILTSVPPIEAAVRDPVLDRDVPPLDVSRSALTAAGRPRPILGATIQTVYDAGLLASLNATVVIRLHGKELARTAIDFRGID